MTAVPLHPSMFPGQSTAQTRTLLRLSVTVAGALARRVLLYRCSRRRGERWQVCSAARILAAVGVQVRVVPPAVPWPRQRPARLVVGADVGWLGDLAVLTAVPRAVQGWAEVGERALPFRSARRGTPSGTAPDEARCAVEIRYRGATGYLDRPPTGLAEIVSADGVVIEVHLLPVHEARQVAAPLFPVAA